MAVSDTTTNKKPWKIKEKLREAYYDERTTKEVAEDFGCSTATIYRWIDKFGFERRESYDGEWANREKLIKLYWGERLSQKEIADRFGCDQSTLSTWFQKHGIPTRYTEKPNGTVSTTQDGYVYYSGGNDIVWIHQLLAIADGYDPETVFSPDMNCHHQNRVSWDNRKSNIELLSVSEHTNRHRDELIEARHG